MGSKEFLQSTVHPIVKEQGVCQCPTPLPFHFQDQKRKFFPIGNRKLCQKFIDFSKLCASVDLVDGETLKSRLVGLLQKSRKAVRIYTTFDKSADMKSADREGATYTALQLEQWQAINTDLQRQLGTILDRPHTRLLSNETVGIRDHFYGLWRSYEAELRTTQNDLGEAAARGDFVKAAVLAKSAVILKAREQAAEAAHHEIQIIVERFKLGGATWREQSTPNTTGTQSGSVPLTDELITLQDRPISLGASVAAQPTSVDAQQSRPMAKVIQLRRTAS